MNQQRVDLISHLSISKASISDSQAIYKLRYSDSVRLYFENKSVPKYSEHREYLSQYVDEYTVARLGLAKSAETVGFCRMKCVSVIGCFRIIEPSIAIGNEFRNNGIAFNLLNKAEERLSNYRLPSLIFGKTHLSNNPCMQLFEKSEYKRYEVEGDCNIHYLKLIESRMRIH